MAPENKTLTRFAPSPSGRMHAGNVFASLMAWLFAKQAGGSVVLRIEDLDPQRSKQEYADQLCRDFEYLGLTWDAGPYFQHTRQDAYGQAFERLQKAGEVYPCFCTRADIHAAFAPHTEDRSVYAGTCKRLSAQEQAFCARTRRPAFRLSVPPATYRWLDGLQGPQSFDLARSCGDFVVRRSDGVFSYQLAVVVDDAEQGVDLVVRGCDLIGSTPQQCFMQDLLGYPRPSYIHVPLIVDAEGRKLSKRNGDTDMGALKRRFGSAEAILGHIAGIAGIMPTEEACSAEELLQGFSVEGLRGKREIRWR